MPSIVVGIRLALSISMIIVIVTEMLIGAEHGLGTRIQSIQIASTARTPGLFGMVLVIGIIGFILNIFFIYLERKLGKWKNNA